MEAVGYFLIGLIVVILVMVILILLPYAIVTVRKWFKRKK